MRLLADLPTGAFFTYQGRMGKVLLRDQVIRCSAGIQNDNPATHPSGLTSST